MKKNTALTEFIENVSVLEDIGTDYGNYNAEVIKEVIKMAISYLEKEKEQIMQAYCDGCFDYGGHEDGIFTNGDEEQYFNDNYNNRYW